MKYVMLTIGVLFASCFGLVGCLVLKGLVGNLRELRLLAALPCPRCQLPYGKGVARRSKAQYQQDINAAFRQFGVECQDGVIGFIDFDDEWPVECPQCGHRVKYDPTERKLVAADETESFAPRRIGRTSD